VYVCGVCMCVCVWCVCEYVCMYVCMYVRLKRMFVFHLCKCNESLFAATR
jgi:hypothetical protein